MRSSLCGEREGLVDFVVGHALAWSCDVGDAAPGAVSYHELDEERFPRLRQVAPHFAEHHQTAEFEFGLETFTTGLALRLRRDERR